MMKRGLFVVILMMLGVVSVVSKDRTALVAIFSDEATLNVSGKEIEAYADAIRKGGKRCVVLEDRWGQPDSIRNVLSSLYRTDNLEGAIFIGDIPVPMLRDAQHLTTAFKMDQGRPKFDSSVPSDRFYDDFDLKFDYLGKDDGHGLFHYYSLRADSPQYISCDIYSARIKAPEIPGKTKYEAISEYLRKVAREKEAGRKIRNIAYFAGHGYNSESLQARVDEAVALRNQFRELDGRISFTNYTRDNFVKDRFQAMLEDENIDIAFLHHHGSDDMQYLSATPYVSGLGGYLDNARRFIRLKLRAAKDTTEAKRYYIEKYGVPEDWFKGVSDSLLTAEDEAFNAAMDVAIPDTYGRKGGPAFILHDACYNGSFHLDDYIAGHYIFNPGKTVVVKGNTVNTLQDTWPLELAGLLDKGVCVGNWLKNVMTLESHIIGDPTWRFTPGDSKNDLDRLVVAERDNPGFWRKVMKKSDGDVKAFAVKTLSRLGAISPDELLDLQKNDSDPSVRLEAFICIRTYSYPYLVDAILNGLCDSYELHRRLAAIAAGKNGAPELLPRIAEMYFDPTLSDRVEFQLRTALEMYEYSDVEKVFSRLRACHPGWPTEESYTGLMDILKRSEIQDREDFAKLADENLTYRQRRLVVSSEKNGCTIKNLDPMLSYLKDGRNMELRMLIAETLGWYVYSSRKGTITEAVRSCLDAEANPGLKNEMTKTLNRLNPVF